MSKRVRVRYAPSPTGYSHIGGARSALFNYLFAKHHNGDFIIRIEDTDIERNVEGGTESQINDLVWLGIIPDESPVNPGKYGPYKQMERLDIYQKYTDWLLEKGYAYKCYCTPEELEKEREEQLNNGTAPKYSGRCLKENVDETKPYAIRIKVPENKVFKFNDMVRGEVSFDSDGIGDWVIVKANGIPTYNYAVVIDDHSMEISHVFRGEEHLSNTPKQLMLYEYFGWIPPLFGHMTLVTNEQHKKLSKRDGSIIQFVDQYRDMGYLPDAIFNFLGLLGWSPVGEEEIFTKEKFIEMFDVNRLSKSPSMFDKEKLKWINNQYIKATSLDDIYELCLPFIKNNYDISNYDETWLKDLVKLFHDQISCGQEIIALVKPFFETFTDIDEEAKAFLQENDIKATIICFQNLIKEVSDWNEDNIKECLKKTQKELNVKGKMLYMPIRIATTGIMHGPDLINSILLYGKDKILKNIDLIKKIIN